MSCHAEPDPLKDAGAISPYVVAGLAGLDPDQLERWRADGLLPASVINDDPDREEFGEPPWYYLWNEHHRVLGAAKLLELGLPIAELPAALARLDEACPRWAVTLIPKAIEAALPPQIDHKRFFAERWHEGPLGKLNGFSDAVDLDPHIGKGDPTARGRGVDACMLAGFYRGGLSVERIAADYRFPPSQIRRIIEFEQALRSSEIVDAPAAG